MLGFADVKRHDLFSASAAPGAGIPTVVRVLEKLLRQSIAGMKLRLCPGPAGIFPLSFGWEPVGQSFLLA